MYDGDGHLRGFAKVTQDLSERRQLMALEKASQNVNEFIAMLAHELRNPLAPIRTAVKVMGNPAADANAREQMRETIDRQSAHLARIVDDLVDISRITRGAIKLERAPEDLAAIARQALETSAPAVQARGHSIAVVAPPMPVTVIADRHRLNQVISNLIANAARYTPEGGSIELTVEAREGSAWVRVKDNGQGIDPEMRERIFDMFVQGRSPLERVSGGLGVGLALSRRLVELHGGSLTVNSEGIGKGSEFVVRLELPAEIPASEPKAAAEPPATSRRILVVDDNADAADTLEALLKSLGHTVVVSHEGSQAIEAATRFRPEIALLDIGMPGMSGYELARRLRALWPNQPLRIVAITGWGQEMDRQQSREAGFDMHLVKPVELDDLQDALAGRIGPVVH